MTMESPTTSPHLVVSEFEGAIPKNEDSFSYFMLVASEASCIIRFTILLFLWPVIALLDVFGYKNASLKLMIFIATAGVHESEIELVEPFCQSSTWMT
ncbi:unnamed protein product [Arabis nemorensis]|uniref:Glycerol-3-phosphate acyltransferase RAM2/GPAT1-8 HAD-like domain-containing protein n=1 Tax=Arabis nemorensis TaxID=586526 RepID=A0A565B8S1_9BRAS|nr:unnamed protein product [Arabis nemorensis]